MAYGNLGYSHHSIQDVACLRGMPNLTLISPADPGETRGCVEWLSENPGPSYLRLGKAGESALHSEPFTLNYPLQVVRRNSSIAVVATGAILREAMQASCELAAEKIDCDVYSFIRIAPLVPSDFSRLRSYRSILTLEEHVGPGGIGELVRSQLSFNVRSHSICLDVNTTHYVGSQEFLRQSHGIATPQIVREVRRLAKELSND